MLYLTRPIADPNAELHAGVAQTVIKYSFVRDRTLAFNYAVLALNNSFFLEQLVRALSLFTCNSLLKYPVY